MAKKAICIIVCFVILLLNTSCSFGQVNGPCCPICGSLMLCTVYCDDDDVGLGTWYESKAHMDHTDLRMVWQATCLWLCETCNTSRTYKFHQYGEWFCDTGR